MAAVIGDFAEQSRFHNQHEMVGASGRQLSPDQSPYSQRSRSRTDHAPSPGSGSQQASVITGTPPPSTHPSAINDSSKDGSERNALKMSPSSTPLSSIPNVDSYSDRQFSSQENLPASSAPYGRSPKAGLELPASQVSVGTASLTQTSRSLGDVQKYGENTIKVRDLVHIQSFASEDFLSYRGQSGRRRTADDPTLKYEISGMPITDIIEMVAGLLTKITTTNDRQHETLHRPIPSGDASVNMSGQSTSVLAFHGKNVPSITILSYLSRIHKYCPTTYEVFLGLLVYFDRMTERANAAPMQALRLDFTDQENSKPSTSYSAEGSDLADSPSPPASGTVTEHPEVEKAANPHGLSAPDVAYFPLSHFFVVDSFNIHRLVIAGVTCGSKFFSDVFYTNSRYAKVGGLPLAELNHLELQFLLLNDFRLSVTLEELEAYGTMLVEFYAREVIAQRKGNIPANMAYPEDLKQEPPLSYASTDTLG